MTCANHPQNPVAAYCRTCGKPLCTSCARQVMGVIYCENCLAERVSGSVPPPSPYQPAPGYPARPQPAGPGPHPPIAGMLAGFFPFGVGAVYCGQYVKGLAHLVIFIILIVGVSRQDKPAPWYVIFGLSIAAFYFYQLIDAIKSAKAIQVGQPAPDPFGLTAIFSPGERQDFTRGIPAGAVVLIGLGMLFLLHNLGIWFLEIDKIWPVFLIALGGWLLAKRRIVSEFRYRSLTGPAILITIGALSLLDNLHGPGWDRTWPLILLVIGVLKLMERTGSGGGPMSGPGAALPPEQPSGEVNSEVKNG